MSTLHRHFSTLSTIIILLTCWSHSGFGVSFQPPSPDELKMTGEAKAPGAPAIILFREVDRDDRGLTAHEDVYMRIKVFTEEGRKYADIEIPFWKGAGSIVNLHARTIEPDGRIVNFSGKAFDKMIVKARGVKYMAKTFTMPDVQPGSILEYYYTNDLPEYALYGSRWILNEELFTKNALFTLKPYSEGYYHLRWVWHRLPPGTAQPVQGPDQVIKLNASNIQAFQAEDYMPPENEMKSRVDFIYSEETFENDVDKFWKKVGKKRNERLESFIGKRKAMESAVAEIVSPSDSQEVKLQKIYTRVQQIRNTTYEHEKTEQEQKREKETEPENVEAIWKKQYANGRDVTWLFLALARAAGFEASGILVGDRHDYFFYKNTMDTEGLNNNIVAVKLNGKDLYFDPGTAFTPFGMLPWFETGVQGLKLDRDGGTWIDTPLLESADSAIRRKAELKLDETGELAGKLTVTYTGLEASLRRVDERFADDAEHKKYLEDEVKEAVPVACDVELTKQPDWKSSSVPLVAEFDLKVTGWISGAGRRALFPVGLFSATEKRLFDHADRVHPIYFEFPFQRSDDITVDVPLGWQISAVPEPKTIDAKAILFDLETKNEKGTLHLTRNLKVNILMLPVENYPTLRKIFQVVRTFDEQQATLMPGATVGGN
jgi:Domain of Unknown Function with PDB structure (DUF3857)